MNNHLVSISQSNAGRLQDICAKRYPAEACGVLLGVFGDSKVSIKKVIETKNLLGIDAFEMDAYDVFDAANDARKQGLDIVGFFHSHPDGVPYPSDEDVEECCPWDDYIYLLTAIDGKEHCETRAWALEQTNWNERHCEVLRHG